MARLRLCETWGSPDASPDATVTHRYPAGGSAVTDDDSFVCPTCLETQADVYLADAFGGETDDLIGL